MSIPTKAINKYTDCNHKIIFNGLFHRNRNIPNIRLLILNRTLNGQKDSEKKNTAGGIFLSNFKLHHGAVVTTTVRNRQEHRYMDSRKEERAQE